MSTAQRSALIDCTKALACIAIVLHHLAWYGPLPEQVRRVAPGVIDALADHARMAVQVFLVLAGYLAAASLAPDGHARFGAALPKIGQRFVRLVVPYAVALVVVIVVSAAVRPWFDDPAVSPDPDLAQLLAHALLLHGVLGEESLSAGVWYVAIDFQLFTCTVLLLALVRACATPWPARMAQALVVLVTAASLLHFNRNPQGDVWALYFFGAYGLGMMAWWAARAGQREARWWALGMAALVLAALLLQWRPRVLLAGGVALGVALAMRLPAVQRWQGPELLVRLGQMSYSVFLVHFAACLLVNAVVHHFWPASLTAAVLGLVGALVLSLAAGWLLYLRVERQVPSWQSTLRWQLGLVGTGLATTLLAALR